MSTGLNRQKDTPIGGASEFRANLEVGTFNLDAIPVFDGEKFVPGTQTGLALTYGGLAMNQNAGYTADGSVLAGWDGVMPINGTPLLTTPDPVTGLVTVNSDGVYTVEFNCQVANVTNGLTYFFELITAAGLSGFGGAIVGSNQVDSQSVSLSLQVQASAGGTEGVAVSGGSGYDVIQSSLTVTRIG